MFGQLMRDSSIPLYLQLAEKIKEKINQGELKENDQLMTEFALSKAYGVSRITVRKAIESLVDDDILIRRQGIGTFVSPHKLTRTVQHQYQGFTDNCISMNIKPGAKLICAELIDPSDSDIKRLQLESSEKIIRIYRIRYCDDKPVMLEDNHFPQRYAFLLSNNLEKSLHEILRNNKINLVSGTKTVGIVYASKQESAYLNVSNNSALLKIRDINYDDTQKPIYTTKCVINPEKYSLTFKV